MNPINYSTVTRAHPTCRKPGHLANLELSPLVFACARAHTIGRTSRRHLFKTVSVAEGALDSKYAHNGDFTDRVAYLYKKYLPFPLKTN